MGPCAPIEVFMSMVESQIRSGTLTTELLREYTSGSSTAIAGNLLLRVHFTTFEPCGVSLIIPKGSSRLSIVLEAIEAFKSSTGNLLVKPETRSQIESNARFSRRVSRDTPLKLVGSVPGAEFRTELTQRALLNRQGLTAPRTDDLFVAAVLFELATKGSFLKGVLAVRAEDGLLFRGAEGLELGSKALQAQLAGFVGAIGVAARLRAA